MADVHYHQEDTSGASFAVILVALLVIVGFALFAMRYLALPASTTPVDNGTRMNIDLDAPTIPVPTDTTNHQ